MHAHELEQRRLESDLEGALGRQELLVYYQPIVSLETQRMVGAEALLRWQQPEHGLVLPNTFIPVAERTGLIIPIGSWVIEQVFAQLGAWHEGDRSFLAGIPWRGERRGPRQNRSRYGPQPELGRDRRGGRDLRAGRFFMGPRVPAGARVSV